MQGKSVCGNRTRSLKTQAGAGSEPTCLITAGNAFTSHLFHTGPSIKYLLHKGASFLAFDMIKADRLHSPFLSTVIKIFQLFLFLSPQQLHS